MTDASQAALRRAELTTTGSLAAIFALRMFGLFMILPIFAVFGARLEGATPLLIGTAIGAYGLMQALLQIPFGMLSDRFGRRPMLVIGLLLFVAGGVVAALSDTIHGVIAGRALQGAGAIASVIMALIGDVVSERHRTRAMALIGMSVGSSFILALILGPLLANWLGLSGLFWLTVVLGLVAVVVTLWVPSPDVRASEPLALGERFRRSLGSANLRRLDLGILTLHLTMTASFVVLPQLLRHRLGLNLEQHSLLYLVVLVGGFLAMVPLIIAAERRGAMPIKRLAVTLLIVAEVLLALAGSTLWHFVLALFIYFMAFNLLEALLPSLVGRAAPAGTRGTAMGIYSTSQFLGVFIGGQLGGALYQWVGAEAVFFGCAAMGLVWLWILRGMAELPKLDNRAIRLRAGVDWGEAADRLRAVPGVLEAVVVAEQSLALLKVDNQQLDEQALAALTADVQSA
ncbi:MFS transporter [Alloalcanivorax mobilis]|uniref:MFS transporter n=1 Tax=Alloalcanivorax mobilis TaxID=2019569 RepID=UPI000B5B1FEE|nr:MFS transporter [Alloalcanivorax mobilis]ASK36530.1 MFS transporter [Alcanivorax sp. N3-2A]|tara:strand:- start:27367 stop:28737 length:1371 start_codon:yes stop_codon:yes gene_type:complete